MKVVSAEFVTSATGAAGLPADPAPQIALVGRSNVGKSSLINALAQARIARTSAAPGKTRLINVYRIRTTGPARPVAPRVLYLVDLPGYGYARGGRPAAEAFEAMTRDYFGARRTAGVLLTVDARHPGLPQDLQALAWLQAQGFRTVVVATKIDQLTRSGRAKSLNAIETLMQAPVVPVSAHASEGLNDLWQTIVTLTAPPPPPQPR